MIFNRRLLTLLHKKYCLYEVYKSDSDLSILENLRLKFSFHRDKNCKSGQVLH